MSFDMREFSITLMRPNGTGAPYTKTFHCGGKDGFKADVVVEEGGMPSKVGCSFTIYGVSEKTVDEFTSLVYLPRTFNRYNQVIITCNGQSVFKGTLTSIFGNYGAAPNIVLSGIGILGIVESIEQQKQRAINAEDKMLLNDAFALLAKDLGFSFEWNPSVTGICNTTVLQGTYHDQIQQLARENDINLVMYDFVVRIASPKDAPVNRTPILISQDTGLIGYPTFIADGLKFRTLYNPQLHIGCVVNVRSIVAKTSGSWCVRKVTSSLSVLPNGKWEQSVECYLHGRNLDD
jgi:hypothetical protein